MWQTRKRRRSYQRKHLANKKASRNAPEADASDGEDMGAGDLRSQIKKKTVLGKSPRPPCLCYVFVVCLAIFWKLDPNLTKEIENLAKEIENLIKNTM